eukprot:TRINITY_DN8196_c1_g1_i3.p6 TRINITY_DN8196_c1_g1~~TRINITY_DN8196_c1_g1_i3.p6  ORF type:complete len:134 (-),score=7.69 TRINITY_DN8196_c1_g1_i3:2342-2743(-)
MFQVKIFGVPLYQLTIIPKYFIQPTQSTKKNYPNTVKSYMFFLCSQLENNFYIFCSYPVEQNKLKTTQIKQSKQMQGKFETEIFAPTFQAYCRGFRQSQYNSFFYFQLAPPPSKQIIVKFEVNNPPKKIRRTQ